MQDSLASVQEVAVAVLVVMEDMVPTVDPVDMIIIMAIRMAEAVISRSSRSSTSRHPQDLRVAGSKVVLAVQEAGKQLEDPAAVLVGLLVVAAVLAVGLLVVAAMEAMAVVKR